MQHRTGQQRKINKPLNRRPEKIADTISSESAKRIAGREEIVGRLFELAEAAAREHGIEVKKVSLRPAWSHECDERTGVALDVDVIASDDARFFYWEALNERLEKLGQSLPSVDREWLDNEVSTTVMRS
jgi:hypothetical protein